MGYLAAAVAYLTLCFGIVVYVVYALLGWTVLIGLVLGVLGGTVGMLGGLLGGHARIVGPDEVNDSTQFPTHPSAYGRDRAWAHYLARQARVDIEAMVDRLRDLVGRMWGSALKVVAIELWWVFWPLLLLPFVLLGAITLGATAAAASMIALLVPVLTVVALVWGGAGQLLRWGDALLRRRNRAEARCPFCFWRTTLPSYACSCGVVHRDVRPSRLGVLWHRCRCGAPMPTTVSRAGATRTPQCPQCDEQLELGSGVLTDVSVPVFGPASAGKTSLIYASLAALEDEVTAAGGALEPRGSAGEQRYRDGVEQVRAGRVAKTEASGAPVGLVTKVTVSGRSALLHTFDAAGEFFSSRERNADMRFLDHAGQMMVVIDPFSIPQVADQTLTPTTRVEAAPASEPPERAYRATVLRLRDQGVRLDRTALAVVVVKADLLGEHSVAVGLTPEHDAVRAWLVATGEDHVVTEAERDFAEVRYFLVSSRTGWRADDPRTALAPLRWLGGRARLPLPTPVREPA